MKTLLNDKVRNDQLRTVSKENNVVLDYTHCKVDEKAMQLLQEVAKETQIFEKINEMFTGEKINTTENRSVLHVSLRKPSTESLIVDGRDVVKDVHEVNQRIQHFTS